jgi:uncharacterized protein YabN with tetrapyrrole methylase and pyrophosphatase domain
MKSTETTIDSLILRTNQWAKDVGIEDKGNPIKQWEQMRDEVNELGFELELNEKGSHNIENICDELGDVFVTAIIEAMLLKVSPAYCLEIAVNKIEGRVGKGKMIDGNFVKNSKKA